MEVESFMVEEMLLLYKKAFLLLKIDFNPTISTMCYIILLLCYNVCGLYAFCMTTAYQPDVKLTILGGTEPTVNFSKQFNLAAGDLLKSDDFFTENTFGIYIIRV